MAIITNDGRAYLASKQAANQPIKLVKFVFCNVPGVTKATALSEAQKLPPAAQQVHSQAVDKQGYINPDSVVYSSLLNTLTGDFTFNWVGLVSDDNRLVMYSVSDPLQKNATKAGTPGNVLSRSFVLQLQNIAANANITIAAESWQIDSMAQFVSLENRLRKSVAGIAGRSVFFKDAMKVIKTGNGYQINGGDAVLAGYTVSLSQPIALTGLVNNPFIYLDVAIKNNINGSSIEVKSHTDITGQSTDYVTNGVEHFLIKIARVNSGQAVDMREGVTSKDNLKDYLIGSWRADISTAAQQLTQQESENRAALKTVIDGEQTAAHTALKTTIDSEQTAARTALKQAIDSEQTAVHTALKTTIDREQSRARAVLKTTIATEQAAAHTALKQTIDSEQSTQHFELKSSLETKMAQDDTTLKTTIATEQAAARTALKQAIDSEQAAARAALKATIDDEQVAQTDQLKQFARSVAGPVKVESVSSSPIKLPAQKDAQGKDTTGRAGEFDFNFSRDIDSFAFFKIKIVFLNIANITNVDTSMFNRDVRSLELDAELLSQQRALGIFSEYNKQGYIVTTLRCTIRKSSAKTLKLVFSNNYIDTIDKITIEGCQ